MNKYRTYMLLLLSVLSLSLQAAIRVTADAPQVVAQGEQFQLRFTVNSASVKDVHSLAAVNGFDVLYGPARSVSYSMSNINGKSSQSQTSTYTYVLMAKRKGTFTMPRLTLTVGGQNYTSNAVRVKVVTDANAGRPDARYSQPQAVRPSSNTHISNKDLLIAVTANKSVVYEQEPVVLTYRVYTRLNLTQLSGKMPDLKGFVVKEIPLPQQKSFSVTSFRGQNYYTTVWSQYIMYPQQTGRLVVPQIKFDGVVVFSNPNEDLLDAFFNGSSGSIERHKTVIAPSLAIQVKPLPAKPSDFSGGVGNFTIKAIAKNQKLKENETLDLQVIISGSGNVDLIKAPHVEFPASFDTYDPKMSNNTKLSAGNTNGSLVIDYLAVPKTRGRYTIPPISFTYFDTQTHTYRTIKSQPLTIEVAKGEKNIYSDKQQEILARSDIRFIKLGDAHLHTNDEGFYWNSIIYWLSYLGLAVVFILAVWIVSRRRSISSNLTLMRSRGANRMAVGRLKQASRFMQRGQSDAFYDEMIQALSGYVSDKLNIPVAELSKERMAAELTSSQVAEDLNQSFIALLDQCEFLRYAGGADKETKMTEVYQQGLQMISKLDAIIKKHKR